MIFPVNIIYVYRIVSHRTNGKVNIATSLSGYSKVNEIFFKFTHVAVTLINIEKFL